MGLLRKMFGSSDEVWVGFAEEIGGRYQDSSFWKNRRITADDGEWTVTLDVYSVQVTSVHVTYTRLRAPYVNPDGFRFSVRRARAFDGLWKKLGMQDVEVGHPQFDEAFVIQGTDEHKLRRLFANPRLRELLTAQPDVAFAVKDDEGWFGPKFPEGVDELEFCANGYVTDAARLKDMLTLFGETLRTLCHIGSAYEKDPGLTL